MIVTGEGAELCGLSWLGAKTLVECVQVALQDIDFDGHTAIGLGGVAADDRG